MFLFCSFSFGHGRESGHPRLADIAPTTVCTSVGRRRWPARSRNIQTVYKPGSVHALRRWTAIPLGPALRRASRDQPGRRNGNVPGSIRFRTNPAAPIRSCSRWGLPCRPCHQGRGALLPHRFTLTFGACASGGLFSVALSLGSPPPAVSRHRIPVEPGLSSTSAKRRQRPSNRLDFRSLALFQPPASTKALIAAARPAIRSSASPVKCPGIKRR